MDSPDTVTFVPAPSDPPAEVSEASPAVVANTAAAAPRRAATTNVHPVAWKLDIDFLAYAVDRRVTYANEFHTRCANWAAGRAIDPILDTFKEYAVDLGLPDNHQNPQMLFAAIDSMRDARAADSADGWEKQISIVKLLMNFTLFFDRAFAFKASFDAIGTAQELWIDAKLRRTPGQPAMIAKVQALVLFRQRFTRFQMTPGMSSFFVEVHAFILEWVLAQWAYHRDMVRYAARMQNVVELFLAPKANIYSFLFLGEYIWKNFLKRTTPEVAFELDVLSLSRLVTVVSKEINMAHVPNVPLTTLNAQRVRDSLAELQKPMLYWSTVAAAAFLVAGHTLANSPEARTTLEFMQARANKPFVPTTAEFVPDINVAKITGFFQQIDTDPKHAENIAGALSSVTGQRYCTAFGLDLSVVFNRRIQDSVLDGLNANRYHKRYIEAGVLARLHDNLETLRREEEDVPSPKRSKKD